MRRLPAGADRHRRGHRMPAVGDDRHGQVVERDGTVEVVLEPAARSGARCPGSTPWPGCRRGWPRSGPRWHRGAAPTSTRPRCRAPSCRAGGRARRRGRGRRARAVPLTEKVRAVGSVKVRAMSISGSVAGGTGDAVWRVMIDREPVRRRRGAGRVEEVLGHAQHLVRPAARADGPRRTPHPTLRCRTARVPVLVPSMVICERREGPRRERHGLAGRGARRRPESHRDGMPTVEAQRGAGDPAVARPVQGLDEVDVVGA